MQTYDILLIFKIVTEKEKWFRAQFCVVVRAYFFHHVFLLRNGFILLSRERYCEPYCALYFVYVVDRALLASWLYLRPHADIEYGAAVKNMFFFPDRFYCPNKNDGFYSVINLNIYLKVLRFSIKYNYIWIHNNWYSNETSFIKIRSSLWCQQKKRDLFNLKVRV